MQDNAQTAEENLAYIRTVMEKAKKRTTQAGPFLAGWGTMSAIVTVIQYLAVVGKFPLSIMPLLWIAFGVIGGIASGIYGNKLEIEKGKSSLNELTTTMLFSCVGITLGVFFMANMIGVATGFKISLDAAEISSVICIVMAIAFFVSSYSTGIGWFKTVAVGWWMALVIFVMQPFGEDHLLLLIAALDFILLAVPGYKLMALARKAERDKEEN